MNSHKRALIAVLVAGLAVGSVLGVSQDDDVCFFIVAIKNLVRDVAGVAEKIIAERRSKAIELGYLTPFSMGEWLDVIAEKERSEAQNRAENEVLYSSWSRLLNQINATIR